MMTARHNYSDTRGFTLIELIVAITIIAILSVIGFATYSGIQSTARDARRKEDIDAIAKAIEFKKANTGSANYASVAATDFSAGTIPTDPNSAIPYVYSSPTATKPTTVWSTTPPAGYTVINSTTSLTTTGATFTVCAWLEGGSGSVYCRSSVQ